jgi:hypothetical protein
MASGPDHYRVAERLLVYVTEAPDDPPGSVATVVAQAQVHATLALAAATALGREGEGRTQPSKDKAAWFDVAAECRKAQA